VILDIQTDAEFSSDMKKALVAQMDYVRTRISTETGIQSPSALPIIEEAPVERRGKKGTG